MDNNRNLQTNLYKTHTKTKFMEENSMKKNNRGCYCSYAHSERR